jgi:hypothetical protein
MVFSFPDDKNRFDSSNADILNVQAPDTAASPRKVISNFVPEVLKYHTACKTTETTHPITQHHISCDWNLQQGHHENPISQISYHTQHFLPFWKIQNLFIPSIEKSRISISKNLLQPTIME